MNVTDNSAVPAATGSAQEKLLSLISRGKNNAITAIELVSMGAFSSTREITLLINKLRRRGVVICSSCTPPMGYYYPGSKEEVEAFCAQMNGRITEISKAKRAAEMLIHGGEIGEK